MCGFLLFPCIPAGVTYRAFGRGSGWWWGSFGLRGPDSRPPMGDGNPRPRGLAPENATWDVLEPQLRDAELESSRNE